MSVSFEQLGMATSTSIVGIQRVLMTTSHAGAYIASTNWSKQLSRRVDGHDRLAHTHTFRACARSTSSYRPSAPNTSSAIVAWWICASRTQIGQEHPQVRSRSPATCFLRVTQRTNRFRPRVVRAPHRLQRRRGGDYGCRKAQCAAGKTVVGLSVSPSTGHAHRLLCCKR
jgi:hypothetical protein